MCEIHDKKDEILNKKELLKKRVKKKFRNRKLTEKELEGLKESSDEELIQYSRKLLAESDD